MVDLPEKHCTSNLTITICSWSSSSIAVKRIPTDWLTALLEIFWLLVAILSPLWINLWASQPFELSKVMLVRTVVWLLVGCWLLRHLSQLISFGKLLRQQPLWWPTVGVVVALAASTITAVDWRLSVFGSYERSQGLLTQLSYLLLFLVVATTIKEVAQVTRLFRLLVATAVPILGLGLLQAFGMDPLGLVTDGRSPLYATLGRSNFVGAYLAMLLPLMVALWREEHGYRRAALLALLLLTVGVVGLTQARGAWLSALVGIATFRLLWQWPTLNSHTRWWLTIAGMLSVLGLITITLWLGRDAGSTAARLTIWQAVLALIADRPWLGYGLDNLGLVFPAFYPPQLVYYQGRDFFVDRAHNLLLEWMVSGGLVTLLSWLCFYGVLTRHLVRAFTDAVQDQCHLLLAAATAALLANLTGNLVSFAVTATATTHWLLVAAIVALLPKAATVRSVWEPYHAGRRAVWRVGTLMLILVLPILSYQWNLRPLVADMANQRALNYVAVGKWQQALDWQARAVAWWPQKPHYSATLGQFYLERALMRPDHLASDVAFAEVSLQRAQERRPGAFHTWAALGELYFVWAVHLDPTQFAAAEAAYQQALARAPHHAYLYRQWGLVAFADGRTDDALYRLQRAVELDATDAQSFVALGKVQLAVGDVTAARVSFTTAQRWDQRVPSGTPCAIKMGCAE